MGIRLRKPLAAIAAGLCLVIAAGSARALGSDVLTVSAGANYTGDPLEATILESDEVPASPGVMLTLPLSSPLAQLPTDLSIFDSLQIGSGVHRIHVAPGATAGTVDLLFTWVPDSDLFLLICETTVGGLPPGSCLTESAASQDLTDFLFPASVFPDGAPFHVTFQSDSEPVPEPSAVVLVACGFIGLFFGKQARHSAP